MDEFFESFLYLLGSCVIGGLVWLLMIGYQIVSSDTPPLTAMESPLAAGFALFLTLSVFGAVILKNVRKK